MEFKGYKSIVKTTAGKTGIGLEVRLVGMQRYSDLSEKQKDAFKKQGFRWMKALWEETENGWEMTREGFFYKAFKTKKARDEQYSSMMKHIAKENAKAVKAEEPKAVKAEKKAEKKAVKAEKKAASKAAKSFDKMTKAELIAALQALTA